MRLGRSADGRMCTVPTHALLRDRLRAPTAVFALVLTQVFIFIGYLAFWVVDSGPTNSDLRINLEVGSFFVMPFVGLVLLVPSLWLLRQPLSRRAKIAVRCGLWLTGIWGCFALAFAAMLTAADVIFWLTDF